MKTEGINPPIRHTRIVKKKCPFCGNDSMFSSRSETGRAFYKFKCSKCKGLIK